MNSLDSNSIESGLQATLHACGLQLSINETIFTVERSANESQEKIIKIIRDVGFCPIFSNRDVQGNFVFTIVPYAFRENVESEVEIKDKVQGSDSQNAGPVLSKKAIEVFENLNLNLMEFATYDYNRKSYSQHYEKNRKNILACAHGLSQNALILGLGNGSDIPLKELAEQFELITVVDVDMSGMKKAIAKLPLPLQRKVNAIQKDLSGILIPLSRKIEKLSTRLPQKNYLSQLVNLFEHSIMDAEKISFEKHQFVVSSMICSQFPYHIRRYIEHFITEKYKNINASDLSDLPIETRNTVKFTTQRHFKHLCEWVQPQGKVYFSDNPRVDCFTEESETKRKISLREQSIWNIFEKYMNEYFMTQRRQKWLWTQLFEIEEDEAGKKVRSGRAYHVQSFFLKPKRT